MFPVILSVAALYFAYKSNVINREWADVHLRITQQAFVGWMTGDFFVEDEVFYFTATIGDTSNIVELMDQATIAGNELSFKWYAEAIGWETEEIDPNTLPYNQYFLMFALANDGDQIAENLYVECEWYNAEDDDALRGEDPEVEGVEPEEWKYGPGVLAPGQWVIIPIASCFLRIDPNSEELSVRYIGDYYNPVAITYESTVSGTHRIPVNLDDVPQTMTAFTNPPLPEADKTGEESVYQDVPERERDEGRTSGRDSRDYRRD